MIRNNSKKSNPKKSKRRNRKIRKNNGRTKTPKIRFRRPEKLQENDKNKEIRLKQKLEKFYLLKFLDLI